MGVSLDSIKELRNRTSASIAACKTVLEETNGDLDKAAELMRKRGLQIAAQKQSRAAKEGRVEAYIHTGSKIGVLLEVDCETDFVARNSEFSQFTRDVAMQIAACDPKYIKREDVPAEIIDQEADKEQYFKTYCLLDQPFVKDQSLLVKDNLGALVAKFNENIFIRRFVRYRIGE
jgi:elongation factor Ts